MRKKLVYLIAALCFIVVEVKAQEDLSKKIIGEWCNPYTYESTGELKGFNFKKGGKCEAINIPTLELKTWVIKDGRLIIKGFDIQPDGTKQPYETNERIESLTADTLELVTQEENPRLVFVYMNTKVIKEKVEVKK